MTPRSSSAGLDSFDVRHCGRVLHKHDNTSKQYYICWLCGHFLVRFKIIAIKLYIWWHHESLSCGYYSFLHIYRSAHLCHIYRFHPGLPHGCDDHGRLLTLFADKTNYEFMCVACMCSKLPRIFCCKRINTSLSNCASLFYCMSLFVLVNDDKN